MSDSVRPQRRQPTRPRIPGILQAITLEWVAISFSNAWKWKVKVKLLSRVRLLATPWTAAHQAPVHEIFQARILEWIAIPFSRGSSHPTDWTQVSHIEGRFFAVWITTTKTQNLCTKKSTPWVTWQQLQACSRRYIKVEQIYLWFSIGMYLLKIKARITRATKKPDNHNQIKLWYKLWNINFGKLERDS